MNFTRHNKFKDIRRKKECFKYEYFVTNIELERRKIILFIDNTITEDECRTASKEHYGDEVYLTGKTLA